jgi:hypothetical protein
MPFFIKKSIFTHFSIKNDCLCQKIVVILHRKKVQTLFYKIINF